MSHKFLIIIAILFFLFSCEDKTVDYGLDEYFVEIATAQNKDEFLLDNGNMLFSTPDNERKLFDFGDRVLINYSLLPQIENERGYTVEINHSTKIPLGKLTQTSDSVIRSSASAPILLESIWLGSHYLNMQFYINFKSVTHTIGLLVDSTKLENDIVRMYFIHDTKNDSPGYPSHTYLSFDLKEVLGIPENARQISVQINSSNYGNKTYNFVY